MSYPIFPAGPNGPLSRRSLLTFGVPLAGVLLAACGTAGGASSGAKQESASARPAALPVPRTVEYWSQQAAGVGLDTQTKLIERYQSLNPGVTVSTAVAKHVNTIPEKTVAAVAAGTPPDAAVFDRFMIASFAVRDTFTPLTDLARRDAITGKDYYPFAWNEAQFRGKLYALPFQTGLRALYYNRTHLQEAGLDPDTPPKSLDELDQWALRVTRREGDRLTRVGFIPWIGNSHFYTWGWLFGGEFYDEKTNKCVANDPADVRALDWVAGYVRRYGDAPLRAFQGTFKQVEGGAFLGGLVTFFHTVQNVIDQAKRAATPPDYGVTPLPPAPGQTKTSTWAGGFGYIIPRGAKQVEAGWHLIKFLGSDEGEGTWTAGTLTLPVRVRVAENAFWREQARDPHMKTFLDLLPIAHWRPVMPAAQALWDELSAAVESVRKGELLPKDALDGVVDRVNVELAKYP